MTGNSEAVVRWLFSQDRDKLWDVKEHKARRSLNANAYFHVLCQKIAEATRQSMTETKNQMLADYGQIDTEIPTIILRDEIDWKKVQTIHLLPTSATRTMDDGKLWRVYRVIRGSHTYDTREMARLIDGTIMEARQLDIETMPPAELERMLGRWKPDGK